MKRLIAFAHYDKDAVVDDYVLRLLDGIKPFADRIVFVSDSPLSDSEAAKILNYGECVFARRHEMYDFGSWKIALSHVWNDLEAYDELVIMNDSCFGPIADFQSVFDEMDRCECDFWGLTGTHLRKKKHFSLNSYFMAFRKSVLKNPKFKEFWSGVEIQKSKSDVVYKYEFGISDLLHAQGYKSNSYCGWFHTDVMVSSAFFPVVWRKKKCPLVKVKLFRLNPTMAPKLDCWLDVLGTVYPRLLVDNLVERYLGVSVPDHYNYRYPTFKTYWGSDRLISTKARYTKSKKWWRYYVKFLGIPVLMLILPSGIKKRDQAN
ncbi:rhamnan synthesis F family protein [Thalassospira lucentensis]|uniref:rhamnan synthesis F family protein n=1 Tax=Thalassospira lucentensis TaxID=168935 RepID=UPI003AA9727B